MKTPSTPRPGFKCKTCGRVWKFQKHCPTCDRVSKQSASGHDWKAWEELGGSMWRKRRFPTGACCAVIIFCLSAGHLFAAQSGGRRDQNQTCALPGFRASNRVPAEYKAEERGKAVTQTSPFDRLADAILRAEGVWTYGVKTVSVASQQQARRVCLNTIRHAWATWDRHESFIEYLGSIYCPTTGPLTPAEVRLNRNWVKNVTTIYRQKKFPALASNETRDSNEHANIRTATRNSQ